MPLEDYPRLFEAHMRPYDEDLGFWLRIARARRGRILELGCGTGRVMLVLARHGCTVAGLDRDAGMLARAAKNLAAEPGLPVSLHQADLRCFDLPDRFAAVIAPCNTLSSLNDEDFTAALEASRRHLAPGGSLAAELPAAGGVEDIRSDEPIDTFEEPERRSMVQVYAQQTLFGGPARLQVVWCYDELLADGQVERTQVPIDYYLRTAARTTDLLHQAGFTVVEVFGDYDLAPCTRRSARLLVVAE